MAQPACDETQTVRRVRAPGLALSGADGPSLSEADGPALSEAEGYSIKTASTVL
jgi:hypothetical protein